MPRYQCRFLFLFILIIIILIFIFIYFIIYFMLHFFLNLFLGPLGEYSESISSFSQSEHDSLTTKIYNKEDNKMNINRLWTDFQFLAHQNILLTESSTLAPLENLYPPLPYGSTEKPPMQNLIQDLDSMFLAIRPPGGMTSSNQNKSSSSTMSAKCEDVLYFSDSIIFFFVHLIIFLCRLILVFSSEQVFLCVFAFIFASIFMFVFYYFSSYLLSILLFISCIVTRTLSSQSFSFSLYLSPSLSLFIFLSLSLSLPLSLFLSLTHIYV